MDERRDGLDRRDDGDRQDLPRQALDGEQRALEALQIQTESRWEGPMPSPSVLYQYELVQKGLAERIMAMAETAATGDIKTRDKLANAEIERARTGQSLAFLLALIAVGGAIWFFAVHNDIAGGILLGVPAILLIRSFLGR